MHCTRLSMIRSVHSFNNVQAGKKFVPIKKAIEFVNSSGKNENLEATSPQWERHKAAIKKKTGGQRWNPNKKLSREQMEGIRLLKKQFPKMTASDLGSRFKVSPEAISKILKSKWHPNDSEAQKLQARWKKRGEKIKNLYKENPLGLDRKLVLTHDKSAQEIRFRVVLPEQLNNSTRNSKDKEKQFHKKRNGKLHLLENLISK
ncbi:hypothetical protein KAFR_0A07830 [Kazachstania africana CBS 2517]|uniref:Required for respiratory growth protein 9, mitochondrial n=1 Tax=Kazachstania africana (strain ATCC 22294 / BCRC 22015 / CBS 2517 / CECT 1963 / NBRC 1671 / NRRL Y-8276) TaxID=1071382 RepID=H2APB7_KAZAF|nr:hypothetical protein KAFR_0A07830 [Kazachstania africana CBS 2517]CCF56217.1 hypothetical protein KAFR_0A07830 [Kazachstania africana CBS 2517]